MIIRVPPQHKIWTWSLGKGLWFMEPSARLPALVSGMARYLLEDMKGSCHNKA